MKPIPILIDTDPGTDDAIALLMCLANPQLDIRGITTVSGNVSQTLASKNARNIVAFYGAEISVSKGATKPLKNQPVYSTHIHGENGLGPIRLPESTKPFDDLDAPLRIYEEAIKAEGELELLTLGAMTNIAHTILRYPDVVQYIKKITFMGGSLGQGNRTAAAEFNIYVDPEAAKIVFDSGIPLTMVGLNVTHNTFVTKEENARIKNINHPVAQVVSDLIDYTVKAESIYSKKGAIMHDPLAAVILMAPYIAKTVHCHGDIELEGTLTRGMTVIDLYGKRKEPNLDVVVKVDNKAFVQLLFELLENL